MFNPKLYGKTSELSDEFEYVKEFDAYVKPVKYQMNGREYEDILCVNRKTGHIFVDIAGHNRKPLIERLAKDLRYYNNV